jgi:hypothetical protein
MSSDSLQAEARERGDGDCWTGAVWRPPPGKRGAFLLDRLVATGGEGVRVRRLGGDRAGEIRLTRFVRNEAVTFEEMFAFAGERTRARCVDRPVLAIQDTTVVRSEGGGGLYLHPTIALDGEDGAILGLVHAEFLSRESGRKGDRRQKDIAQKESWRWLEGTRQASLVCAAARQITVIADRESDIFAAFALRPANAHLLVRAAQDRALEEGERLFAHVDALAPAGRTLLALPAKPGRPARKAELAVRLASVHVKRPKNGVVARFPETIAMTIVDVREIDPPPGETIHWRLLTTHHATRLEEALAIVDMYRRRWAIEQLFRTLKTKGFDIEALRIADDEPRRKLVAAVLIAAITIQQLVHARDGEKDKPARPILDAFEPEDLPLLEAYCAKLEGKTERQKNPHPKGSLAYAAWVCARLGGWTGYYGKPGPLVMLLGWKTFQAAKDGLDALQRFKNV